VISTEGLSMPEQAIAVTSSLPTRAPDLVLAEGPGGSWTVLGISTPLAELAGVIGPELVGRSLGPAFSGVVPPLTDLASEILQSEQVLSGVLVRFPRGGGRTLAADVYPGGLTADYRWRTVAFDFREPRRSEAAVASAHGLVGASPALHQVLRKIQLYGPTDAAVVITGETGTGKELVAKALHQASGRQRGPYIAVNCSAISDELLESELFGHEKGAFTGAVRSHRGRFERADGGTLFLDEIGDMPLRTQAKLLRALEGGRIERVGAETEKHVDVRVLAATNVPLEQAVGAGRFRADLYHRLCVLRIHLPALRERPDDISPLVEHFLQQFSSKYGRRIHRLTPEALALLQSYQWPGNIRELRNVLERVFIETEAQVIGARAFSEWIRERQSFTPGDWGQQLRKEQPRVMTPPYPLPSQQQLLPTAPVSFLEAELLPARNSSSARSGVLDAVEIGRAYRAAGGNLAGAARLLGVHRATLYRYLEKLGLDREQLEKEVGEQKKQE
jgi:DNA-binding NtrC family response regulator